VASCRSGKSSRKWAPRLSWRFNALDIVATACGRRDRPAVVAIACGRRDRLRQQVAEGRLLAKREGFAALSSSQS
jgi:hypothetical protein